MKSIFISLLFITCPMEATQEEEEMFCEEDVLEFLVGNRMLIDSLYEDYYDLKKRVEALEDKLKINIIYDEKVRTV